MPPHQGEKTLVNLFADVHYLFCDPAQKPLHHRFQKASYVYIHHNASANTARMEIANDAGTPEQDAVCGPLVDVDISHNYKRPQFLNVTVHPSATLPKGDGKPLQHWYLPSFDIPNERKYLYPVHSLDIYFWTPEDAQDFLSALQTTSSCMGGLDVHLPHPHTVIETLSEPRSSPSRSQHNGSDGLATSPEPDNEAPSHPAESVAPARNDMRPVVQHLEQAAVTSSYQHKAMDDEQKLSQHPPPPRSAQPPQHQKPRHSSPLHGQGSPRAPLSPSISEFTPAYIPMAYNPSAPAKPEPIMAREKTPPPIDLESGLNTSLRTSISGGQSQTAPQQHGSYFGPVLSHHSQQSSQFSTYLPPPPSLPPPNGPSPHPQQQRSHYTMSPAPFSPPLAQNLPPPPPSAPPAQNISRAQIAHPLTPPQSQIHPQSFSTPPQQQSYVGQPPFTSVATSSPQQQQQLQPTINSTDSRPSSSYPYPYSPSSITNHHTKQSLPFPEPTTPPAPPPAFQSFFPQSQPPTVAQTNIYAIHSQPYAPSAAEQAAHGKHGKDQEKDKDKETWTEGRINKLEARAERMEKGVNRFLKRLDKGF